jgi:hypothetical protein
MGADGSSTPAGRDRTLVPGLSFWNIVSARKSERVYHGRMERAPATKRLPMGAVASLLFEVNSPHQTGSTIEGVGFNWGCGSRKGGVDHLQGWGLGVGG